MASLEFLEFREQQEQREPMEPKVLQGGWVQLEVQVSMELQVRQGLVGTQAGETMESMVLQVVEDPPAMLRRRLDALVQLEQSRVPP